VIAVIGLTSRLTNRDRRRLWDGSGHRKLLDAPAELPLMLPPPLQDEETKLALGATLLERPDRSTLRVP
jgi:hypothetical protein